MGGGGEGEINLLNFQQKNLYWVIYIYALVLKINKGFPCKDSYSPPLSQPAL